MTRAFTIVPLFGQQTDDHTLPSLERCSTQRTSHPAATCNRWRQNRSNTNGKHEIQIALLRRRTAMTRAVLPNPSARAEWLLAGLMDRGSQSLEPCSPHLTEETSMTTAQTQGQTPPYLMTTMMMTTTSPLSPVNHLRHCSHQASSRPCSPPGGAVCSDLELDSLFGDHGVCSAVVEDMLTL